MKEAMHGHRKYMERCLQLARNGLGLVYPNPMVGSVVVHEGKIIGEGWHQKAGSAHAEVNAIQSVKDKRLLSKAKLYVNLEPCSHYGKTPPCADLIITHKIPTVIIGAVDTNEKVGGQGIKKLRSKGVEVLTKVMESECRELNKRFYTFHEKKRPYVILKWAQSLDGYIFPERKKQESRAPIWISNTYSLQRVHQYRAEEASILVGKNTVFKDNPKLNLRQFSGKGILRLTIDKQLEIPSHFSIMDNSSKTVIFNALKDEAHDKTLYVKLDFNQELTGQIMKTLYDLEIQSIIVEGGAVTLQSFLDKEIWDEARVFEGHSEFHGGIKAPVLKEVPESNTRIINDVLYLYKNSKI